MISWGDIGADASPTFPANFGPATVAIDQMTAVAAMATIAVTMTSLRISCHSSRCDELRNCIATSLAPPT
jgi:hypothetical protein